MSTGTQTMTANLQETIVELSSRLILPMIFIAISIAAFIDQPFTLQGWKNADSDDLFKTISISTFGIIIQLLITILREVKKNRDLATQATAACDATARFVNQINEDTVKITQERKNVSAYTDPCFRQIGEKCLASITDGFDFKEKIVLRGEFLAYESYGHFLDFFLDQQRASKQPLELRAVHSTPIHVWLDRRGERYLKKQKEIIDAGGKIYRVVIGLRPLEEMSREDPYIEAIEKMLAVGIVVYYLDRSSVAVSSEIHNYLWIVDSDYLFRWITHTEGKRVRKAVIRANDSEVRESIKTWDYIMGLLNKKEYGPIESPTMLSSILIDTDDPHADIAAGGSHR